MIFYEYGITNMR